MTDPVDPAAVPQAPAPAPWSAPASRPFAPPAGYAMPPGYGTPVPPGQPAPYRQPVNQHQPAPYGAPGASAGADITPPAPRGAGLGTFALVLSLFAAVVAPFLVGIAAFEIGQGVVNQQLLTSADFDASAFSPVRGWVLLAEVAFWIGTVCGIWALVQGIAAIVQRRGRGRGIAAVVISAIGAVIFVIVVPLALTIGSAVGS
ncbi:hypothetical protein ACWPKO_18745 (plasmid) [Coraliomargarita sp. W4R53]